MTMNLINNVAIIIPTHNRKYLLKQTLCNLYSQTVRLENIIVVNDGSTDGTSEMLEMEFCEVIQLKGDGNLWWTGAVNKGIEFALNQIPELSGIILQNDDVLFNIYWIENLLLDVERNPNTLIGCVNVNCGDRQTITWAGKDMHTWFATCHYFHRGENIASIKDTEYINSFDLIGRGIYIPKDVFTKIGLFDYAHFKHCGDTELPLRARMAGFRLIVTFNAIVYDMPDETAEIDKKSIYKLQDFKLKFFDFRSNAYWKYKYYYGKIIAKNKIQHLVFFFFRMLAHFYDYLKRLKYTNE